MVYNTLVVDDEPMIRFGLTSCVNWESEGLLMAAEASNGEAALQIIKSTDIHILITDIKMPLMDGLELVKQAKQYKPDMKVILVSSYTDFSYAVEAVKLGVVVDYLLKPTMEPDDLLRVLRICKERLLADQNRTEKEAWVNQEAYKQKLATFLTKLRTRLSGMPSEFDWKPSWAHEQLVIAVWKIDAGHQRDENLQRTVSLELAKSKLDQWCDTSFSFLSGDDEVITLIEDVRGSAWSTLNVMHQRLLGEEGLSFTTGVSPAFYRLDPLNDAYKWASHVLEQAFFDGRSKVYLGKILSVRNKQLKMESMNDRSIEQLSEQFAKAYAFADKKQCVDLLETLNEHWRSKVYSRDEIITSAKRLMINMWSHRFHRHSEDMMQISISKLAYLERSQTLEELIALIHNELVQFWEIETPRLSVDAGGAHVIQVALSYIQENYRRDISLQTVSDYVHMSKNYFSEQFKQRTGMNFIDFVIQLRLHYAKHLLEHTSMKVIEVGQESGFNSPKHFLKLFKRQIGCTPLEYREQQRHSNSEGQVEGSSS